MNICKNFLINLPSEYDITVIKVLSREFMFKTISFEQSYDFFIIKKTKDLLLKLDTLDEQSKKTLYQDFYIFSRQCLDNVNELNTWNSNTELIIDQYSFFSKKENMENCIRKIFMFLISLPNGKSVYKNFSMSNLMDIYNMFYQTNIEIIELKNIFENLHSMYSLFPHMREKIDECCTQIGKESVIQNLLKMENLVNEPKPNLSNHPKKYISIENINFNEVPSYSLENLWIQSLRDLLK